MKSPLEKRAKLQAERRLVPGPGSYDIDRSPVKNTKSYSIRERLDLEKTIVERSQSPGPGPTYNVRGPATFAALNGNTGSLSSKVKWSFGKEQREVNIEAIRHGKSVPDAGEYSPSHKMIIP